MKERKILKKEDLIQYLETCNNVPFTLLSFQRKFRNFYKFSIISDTLFCITSKITNNTLLVQIEKQPDPNISDYFKCVYSFNPNEYNFPVLTSKDFILKLIKHDIY